MKNCLFFLIGAFLFLTTSCDDDAVLGDTASVTLNFKAVYDGEPLVCQNSDFVYDYPDGKSIRFNSTEFFIAEVALLEEEGTDEVELIDIDYINFSENTTLDEALQAITRDLGSVFPAGNYKGIKIDIGVPAELNNLNNGDLGANHPLRQVTPWITWESYIFMKTSGIFDIDDNGLGMGDDVTVAHPIGSDDMYHNTLTLLKPIVLEANKTLELNITLDVKKLYENDNGFLDLMDDNNHSSHNLSDLPYAPTFIKANYNNAFTLE